MEHHQAFPDIGSMNDEELKGMIEQLTNEERDVSYRRRVLHGQIDLMRAELVNRLKTKREDGQSLLSGSDVELLTEILLGKVPAVPTEGEREGGGEAS